MRSISLSIAAVLCVMLTACAEKAEHHTISSAQIAEFRQQANRIALADGHKVPLAGLIHPDNLVKAPPGMNIWAPTPLLTAMGIRNGDIVVSVNGEAPYARFEDQWRLTNKPFKRGEINQGPYHLQSEKYVDYVDYLLEMLRTGQSLELSVHLQYQTRSEREKFGLHAAKPRLISVTLDR